MAKCQRLTLGVDVDRLVARRGMSPHDRVRVHYRLTPLNPASRCCRIHLLNPGVRRLQTMKPLLEERRKAVIRLGGVDEQGVPARLRLVQDVEERRAGRLLFVAHVAVPGNARRPGFEKLLGASVPCAAVDEVDLRVRLRGAGRWVDVMTSKVATVGEGILDGQVGKVLASEGNDPALGDEAGELILAGLVE